MGWFEKLIALPQLQSYFRLEDDAFVEEKGWQVVLRKVKQLKDKNLVVKMIEEAGPTEEKDKIILGFLYSVAAENADVPVELPCVDYAGCYLSRGTLKLKSQTTGVSSNYVGMGMDASTRDGQILVEGNVGDYLGYRARRANIEVTGTARDKTGMAIGEGKVRIEGDVNGHLGGNTESTIFEVDGSVGAIEGDNTICTILIGGDVHWGIGENQQECFIRVCGSVGLKSKESGKALDIAVGLAKNSMLLVGDDIYGNIGKGMEVAKIFVWGRVYGEIQASDTGGGFIYLHKRKTPIYERIKKSFGGGVGVKYVSLKDSGYLFAEGPDDVQEIIIK
jgi:hypothetical protein